ncbi:MAG: thiolase family protein [Thermoplasmatota archaeon]
MSGDVVICSAVRTAIGKFGGALRDTPVVRLGAAVVREAIARARVDPSVVDEVIMGNVLSGGLGQNPARQAAIYAGVPVEAGAMTVNKVCGSGLKAMMIAASEIKTGDAGVVVAGGMENMDMAPFALDRARYGYRMNNQPIIDLMVNDGLWDVYNNFHMGMTGEIIAEKYGLSRQEIDEFALSSHQKAAAAIKSGWFKEEIVPVELQTGKGQTTTFEVDEGVRPDTSLEKLAKLPAVFKKGGVVTAGNASQISDGAAATVMMSEDRARELGAPIVARVTHYCFAGTKPELVMYAPVPTINKLLARSGMKIGDFDLIEHNEAFASASVAIAREFQIPPEKFNVHGGAVALGHPIGCSGARVMVTLLHALKRRGGRRGLAAVCLGGGNGVAMAVELP